MFTALLVLHGVGVGAAFMFCLASSLTGQMMGSAFGYGGKPDPLWQLVLVSLFWEIPLSIAAFQALFGKKV